MPTPRSKQISLTDTKYYHCISRCVRHAFLCGKDANTGKSYEHRRQWVEDKILQLARIFCIDVCAYAVMHNHTHIILHVDDIKAKELSDKDVLLRWHSLYRGTLITQAFLADHKLSKAQLLTLKKTVTLYRRRLFDISWFMRNLNENISRRANKEDECTGKFWEGRFKSQALLDEAALLACMAYVDLNPVRAKMAKTPEDSKHTSIKKRVIFAKNGEQPRSLFPFSVGINSSLKNTLPFDFQSYLELIDLTGRCMHNNKKGVIVQAIPILERVNISPKNWQKLTNEFTSILHGPVGREKAIQAFYEHVRLKRRATLTQCKKLLA